MNDDSANASDHRVSATRRAIGRRRSTAALVAIVAVAVGVGSWSLTRAGAEPSSDEPAAAAAGTKSKLEACMRERGADVVLAADDPMVLTDHEVAARYGYGISIPIVVGAAVPAGASGESVQSDLGACADEARPAGASDRLQAAYGRLAATVSEDPKSADSPVRDLDAVVATLPGVDAALVGWQKCVAAAGFDFEDPGAARSSIQARYAALPESKEPSAIGGNGRTVSAELAAVQSSERHLAATDVACRESALFPGLIEAIDAYIGSR